MYQNFMGIDIGKAAFEVAVVNVHKTQSFQNSVSGFSLFYKTYRDVLKNSLVVLETTGGHEMALLMHLQSKGVAVHRADTRKVKYFIRSLGIQGKSDTLDARGLSSYAKERYPQLALYQPPHCVEKKLAKWIQRRLELKQMLVQEKNRKQAPEQTELSESFEVIIKVLKQEIELIDQKIRSIVEQDEMLTAKKTLLCKIPGIGDILSCYLIGSFPELGKRNRREIASLAGLAPHPVESGKKIGYRSTRGGRHAFRSILFMAAMTASRSKGNLGDFYRKLVSSGKKKMVAMVALMRKILVIANAKIKEYLLHKDSL